MKTVEPRIIDGDPDYRVWPCGKAESFKSGTWKTLKPNPNRKGYLRITLCRDGKQRSCKIHHLIARAFLGPRPPGQVVRHLDDDKFNNHVSNLAYGSYSDNAQDAIRNGGIKLGEAHPSAKLSDADVCKVFQLRAEGLTQAAIGTIVGCSDVHVSLILSGKYRSRSSIPAEAA